MGLLLFYFAFAIFFSFLCSILEAVLLSVNYSYIEQKLKDDPSVGLTLQNYKKNIDKPLAAILTLNTLAHTIGAMLVGIQASIVFGDSGWDLGFIYISGEVIVAIILTIFILILSEIIPKTLGANYWRQLAPSSVKMLRVIIFLLYPLVWFTQLITRFLKKDKDMSVFSRADFNAMIAIGSKEGVIQENESKIITNLMRFEQVLTRDIMTPRMVVKAAPSNTKIQDFFEANRPLRFSRIPIYEDRIDNVTGFILKDRLLTNIINEEGQSALKEIEREILIVHESMPIPKLFQKLMTEREHIALVVDEFGGMEGIVTMEDVIETLLGTEIVDEYDNIEDMQALARKNWEARAKKLGILTVDEFDNKVGDEEEIK